jgi:hypothetical protein
MRPDACCCLLLNPAETVYALNLVAEALLASTHPEDNSWGAVVVSELWCRLTEACLKFHPSKSAHAALLLTGPLLQMVVQAVKCLISPEHSQYRRQKLALLLWQPAPVMRAALQTSNHPGLQQWLPHSSLSRAQMEACSMNIKAALQQQVRLQEIEARVTTPGSCCCVACRAGHPLHLGLSSSSTYHSVQQWDPNGQSCAQHLLLQCMWRVLPFQCCFVYKCHTRLLSYHINQWSGMNVTKDT